MTNHLLFINMCGFLLKSMDYPYFIHTYKIKVWTDITLQSQGIQTLSIVVHTFFAYNFIYIIINIFFLFFINKRKKYG